MKEMTLLSSYDLTTLIIGSDNLMPIPSVSYEECIGCEMNLKILLEGLSRLIDY